MPNNYVRFSEHPFSRRMPHELESAVPGFHSKSYKLIRETWQMDKPVSSLSVGSEITEGQAEVIREYFHTASEECDGDSNPDGFIYFSRFPELSEFVRDCDTAVDGLLYGFDAPDVASYIVREGGEISGQNN